MIKHLSAEIFSRVLHNASFVATRSIEAASEQPVVIDAGLSLTLSLEADLTQAVAIVVTAKRLVSLAADIECDSDLTSGGFHRVKSFGGAVTTSAAHTSSAKRRRRAGATSTTTAALAPIVLSMTASFKEFAYYDLTTGKILGRGRAVNLAMITPPIGNPQNMGLARCELETNDVEHYINISDGSVVAKDANATSIDTTTIAASTEEAVITDIEDGSLIMIEPQGSLGLANRYLVDHTTGDHTFQSTAPGTYRVLVRMPTQEDFETYITVT